MDHSEAENIRAADRYLLGQLAAAEREQFEEHFFSCPQCAEEVRAGALFEANARAVFQEEARQPAAKSSPAERATWWAWLRARPMAAVSLAAVCLLGIISVYQSLVLVPRLETQLAEVTAPQAFQSEMLRPGVSRGAELVITVPERRQFLGLRVDLDPQLAFPIYRADFLSASGSTLFSVSSGAPGRPGVPLEFLIPTSNIPPGSYTMIVRGLGGNLPHEPGTIIDTYRFVIKQK
jgi:hypothetical protein